MSEQIRQRKRNEDNRQTKSTKDDGNRSISMDADDRRVHRRESIVSS